MNKDIRFIDSRYKDLFKIPDGGMITITHTVGRKSKIKCRYADDYRFYLDNTCLHICQFAEMMERNGSIYEPTMPYEQSRDLIYAEENADCLTNDKFFKTENGFEEIYYNPDALSGGQVVRVEFDGDDIKTAAKCRTTPQFFDRISELGRTYLIDAGTPEFRAEFDRFRDGKADFEGIGKKTMQGIMKAVGIKPKNHDMER